MKWDWHFFLSSFLVTSVETTGKMMFNETLRVPLTIFKNNLSQTIEREKNHLMVNLDVPEATMRFAPSVLSSSTICPLWSFATSTSKASAALGQAVETNIPLEWRARALWRLLPARALLAVSSLDVLSLDPRTATDSGLIWLTRSQLAWQQAHLGAQATAYLSV